MQNEILKFLEVYSKTMQTQNKYVSENAWAAYKLIISMNDEINELEDENKSLKEKLKKNEQTGKASTSSSK